MLCIWCTIMYLGFFGTMILSHASSLYAAKVIILPVGSAWKWLKPVIQSVLLNEVLMNCPLSSGCMLRMMHTALCIYACALMMGGLGTVGPNLVWIYNFVSNEIVFKTLDPRGIAQNKITNKRMQIQIWCINTKETSNWIFWAGHKIPGSFIDNKVLDADKEPVFWQRNWTLEQKNISM